MADNVAITAGTGTTIAADDIGGVLHQRVKISQGADGVATDVSSAAPLNVTLANTGANATAVKVDGSAVTQPVSGTVAISGSVAVTGASGGTEYTEDAASAADPVGGVNMLVRADTPTTITTTDGDNVAQRGTNYGAAYVQILDNGNKASIDTSGADNESNTSSRLNVRSHNSVFDGATWDRMVGNSTDGVLVNLGANNDVTTTNAGTFAVQESGAALTALQLIDNAVSGSGFNVSQINGVTPLMGSGATGTGSPRVTAATDSPEVTALQIMDDWDNGASDGASVSGDVAHGTADAGEPVKIGGKALSADPTAEATGDRVNALFDLIGRQVMFPYSLKENLVSGAITTAMTGTTSTSLIAAPGAGLYNYITQITVSNAHGTVGTDIAIQDGSGGTTIYTIPAAAVYGGAVVTFPAPLKQPTSNTALFCANVTTGASTKVSASGFKSS